MKKTKILKKNYEFRKVLSKGKYYSGNCIEAFIVDNNKECNFLGLAISIKIGKAVNRNRIKRLLRENYTIMEKDILLGKNIVFLWKKHVDVEKATFFNIKEDMNKIFDKAGMKVNKEI